MGQIAYVLLTLSPLGPVASYLPPLDLHVLSLPPAFNLSHDQTLQLKSFCTLFIDKVPILAHQFPDLNFAQINFE